MGKQNFETLYAYLESSIGELKIKQSAFSDVYRPGVNYAGVIVYMVDGNARWTNANGGRAHGWNGRAFYVVICCTNDWPREVLRDVGQGRVHHYLLRNTLGIDYNQDRIACGGFAFVDGKLKFSSVWLNQRDQTGAPCDGIKYLSGPEKDLVRFAFNDWRDKGRNRVVSVPSTLRSTILGFNVQNPQPNPGLYTYSMPGLVPPPRPNPVSIPPSREQRPTVPPNPPITCCRFM